MPRLFCAVAVTICLLAVPVGAADAQAPPIPIPLPTVPKAHLPGEKVEKFKLVVDGTAHAGRHAVIGGQAGGCDASLRGDIEEDTDFGRGKGLTMEFVRYERRGHTRYGFQRAGRT